MLSVQFMSPEKGCGLRERLGSGQGQEDGEDASTMHSGVKHSTAPPVEGSLREDCRDPVRFL